MDLMLDAKGDQKAYQTVGLDLDVNSRTVNCTLGWNQLMGTLVSGIEEYAPEVTLSAGVLCLQGLLDFQTCNLGLTAPLKATSLMNAVGVDTPAVDTLDDIVQPETVAFLQVAIPSLSKCTSLVNRMSAETTVMLDFGMLF